MKQIKKLCTLIGISIVAFTILNTSSCKKSQDCPREFVVPAITYPYQETYKIGDTLKLVSNYSNRIYENTTHETYNLESVSIPYFVVIYKLDTNYNGLLYQTNKYIEIVSSPIINYEIRVHTDLNSSIFFDSRLVNDSFYTELTMVFKRKGIYSLTFSTMLFESSQDFPGKCSNTNFEITTRFNNTKDNNIHLLSESPNTHFNDWILQKPEDRFYKGSFAYRVID